MKKRKWLAAALAVLMSFSVVMSGCSDEDTDWEEDDTVVSIESEEDSEAEEISDEKESSESEETLENTPIPEGEDLELGAGTVEPTCTSQLDDNPNRTVHRSVKKVQFTPAKMLDGTPLTEEFYFYRSTLNSHGQKAYDIIRAGLLNADKTIEMTVPVKPEDISEIYYRVVMDAPELYYAEMNMSFNYNYDGIVTAVTPVYNELVYYIDEYNRRIEEGNAKALADMWSLGSDIERIKYAHDYLTYTITYELNSPFNQNIYSALVNRRTVCAGYAHAFQYLMQKVGIPCAYVCGMTPPGYHAWNLVKAHGEYYMMDVTWDDPAGYSPNQYRYDYFCITDSQIAKDHTREDRAAYLPAANGTACSFQNAFGGVAYGTDFAAYSGQTPAQKDTPPAEESQEGDWWDNAGGSTSSSNSNQGGNGGQSQNQTQGEYGWWNLLNYEWTQDRWQQNAEDPDFWETYDAETHCYYMWDSSENDYYALEERSEALFILDMETYEWVYIETE